MGKSSVAAVIALFKIDPGSTPFKLFLLAAITDAIKPGAFFPKTSLNLAFTSLLAIRVSTVFT